MFSSILLFKLLRNLTQGFSFEKFSTHFVVDRYVRSGSLFSLPTWWGFLNGLEPNIFDSFRLPSSFFEICLKCALATVFLIGNSAQRTQMTLLIFRLFSNAYEHMCSSLKSVKIAASAVGVRRRTRLISYPDFPRPSGRETSYFKWRHAYSWKQLLWLAIARMEIDYSLNNGHFVTSLLILCSYRYSHCCKDISWKR